jgi:hypothetical protein
VIVSYRSYPRYYTSESYYSKGYYPRYVRYRSYPSYTRVYPRYRTVTYAPTYVYPRYRSYRRYPDSSGINIISALAHGATSVGENYQALLVNTMSLERLPAGPFES